MSQENVVIVRSIYAAWGRGDYSRTPSGRIPKLNGSLAPMGRRPAEGQVWPGWQRTRSKFIRDFEEVHHQADEYIELDHERVLVLQHLLGRGKTSGVDLEQVPSHGGAVLFHLRDGKVTRIVGYFEREGALADVGLSKQDAHGLSDPR